MTIGHPYDPTRRALVVADPRLTKLLQRDPERCASISEYAAVTGIETGRILELFGNALDDGTLGLEIVGEEIFVHTAPAGRPGPSHLPDVAPNLWERLREGNHQASAYALWRLARGLERAGWRVAANPHKILFGLSPLEPRPYLGIHVANSIVPLVVHPTAADLGRPDGLLHTFDHAGAATVGVICDSGALDEMVTATRRWVLGRRGQTGMSVLVLEAPRFNPTLLRPTDAAVTPRAVSRAALDQFGLSDPRL